MTNSGTSVNSSTSSPSVTLMGTNNIAQPQSLIAINSTQIPIKLSKGGNYAAWRSQFENLLFGYGLMGYLDGTKPCPLGVIETPTRTSDNPVAQEPRRCQPWASYLASPGPLASSCNPSYVHRCCTIHCHMLYYLSSIMGKTWSLLCQPFQHSQARST